MYNKTMGCLGGIAHGFKTMYNKTMGCLEGLAKPCARTTFFADNSIFYFLLFCLGTLQHLPHIVFFSRSTFFLRIIKFLLFLLFC